MGESITFLSGDFTEKISPNTKIIVMKMIKITFLSEIPFILNLPREIFIWSSLFIDFKKIFLKIINPFLAD